MKTVRTAIILFIVACWLNLGCREVGGSGTNVVSDPGSDTDTGAKMDTDTNVDMDTENNADTNAGSDSSIDTVSDTDTGAAGDTEKTTDTYPFGDSDTNDQADTGTLAGQDSDTQTGTGAGIPCDKQSDCADFQASYCAINPLSGTGYCTTLDCASSRECPENHFCCDCTSSSIAPQVIGCLTGADADLVETVNCTCDRSAGQDSETDLDTETAPIIDGGVGKACEQQKDCAIYTANYCAFNPILGTGYCTTTDCKVTTDCEKGYACCDCTSSQVVPQVVVCLTNADAGQVVSIAGCTCL